MKYSRRAFWKWLGKKLRGQFLLGLLVMVPLGATILILVWIFTAIDNILQPVIRPIFGYNVPGLGFGVTVVLIYLVGVIAGNVVGKRLIHYGESLLAKVPLVRPIYGGIKQILESFSKPSKKGLLQTVFIEFPRKGIWTVGFITHESPSKSGDTQLNIFIPTAPNPTSGFLQIATEDEVIRTEIPVDKALRMIMSAGKISPPEVSDKLSGKTG